MKKIILSLLVAVGLIGSTTAQTPTGDLTNGLVSFYSFNGNANDSVGGNNGIISNAFFVNDDFRGSINFQADANSKVVIPNNSSLRCDNEFSTSLWFKFNQPWSYHEESLIWRYNNNYPNLINIGVNQDSSEYGDGNYFILFEYGQLNVSQSSQIGQIVDFNNLSSWHMLTCTYGDNASFYLDGQLIQSDPISGALIPNDADFVIGGSINPASGAFNRSISDVGIWNTALSSNQVSELYAAQSVPEPSTYALFGLGAIGMLMVLHRKVA